MEPRGQHSHTTRTFIFELNRNNGTVRHLQQSICSCFGLRKLAHLAHQTALCFCPSEGVQSLGGWDLVRPRDSSTIALRKRAIARGCYTKNPICTVCSRVLRSVPVDGALDLQAECRVRQSSHVRRHAATGCMMRGGLVIAHASFKSVGRKDLIAQPGPGAVQHVPVGPEKDAVHAVHCDDVKSSLATVALDVRHAVVFPWSAKSRDWKCDWGVFSRMLHIGRVGWWTGHFGAAQGWTSSSASDVAVVRKRMLALGLFRLRSLRVRRHVARGSAVAKQTWKRCGKGQYACTRLNFFRIWSQVTMQVL